MTEIPMQRQAADYKVKRNSLQFIICFGVLEPDCIAVKIRRQLFAIVRDYWSIILTDPSIYILSSLS